MILFQNDDCENESQVSLLLYFITLFLQMMIRHQKRVKLASSVTLLKGNFAVLIKYLKLFFLCNYSKGNHWTKNLVLNDLPKHNEILYTYVFLSDILLLWISRKWIYIIHLDGTSSHLWSKYLFKFILICSRLSLRCFEIGNYKKKFIRKQQTELKFKPLIWLAIFWWCTLIKYLLNMHFYSFLHANIEEMILMHKNLYLFKTKTLLNPAKNIVWLLASSIFQRIFCLFTL